MLVIFSGFGATYSSMEYLQEGEWSSGVITFREDMTFGASFVLPHDGMLKNIYVLFSSGSSNEFEEGSTVTPFVCLAVSQSDQLVYTILNDTITTVEPFYGGTMYPMHVLRRGSLTNIDIPIAEGTLVAIVAGIMATGVTAEGYGRFAVSGGVYIE